MKFQFRITSKSKDYLEYIEHARRTLHVRKAKALAKKKEAYYFTQIEDEGELENYLDAYEYACSYTKPISEAFIKTLHGKIFGRGPTPYRKGQNAVFNTEMTEVLYTPPKAKDVGPLMKDLVSWIHTATYSLPIIASIAHYGLNAIHPYYDGNGRTSRLLTKHLLCKGGYDLNGRLCLEDYYFKNLEAYYDALSSSTTSNFYTAGNQTKWVEYFLKGMVYSIKQASRIIR